MRVIHRHEYIPARDGIRLATDLYLPQGKGPFPALVQRTPYGKYESQPMEYAEWMAGQGYACAVQDVRGRHDSEGSWHPYDNHEDTDGWDTIDWLVRQPWSDGKVAFAGSSYLAYTGYMAALSGHEAMKALIARVPATGLFHHHFYMGGIFHLGRLCWGALAGRRVQQWSICNGVPVTAAEKLLAENPQILFHLPVDEIGDLFALPVPWWRTWLFHETEDEHWRKLEAIRHFERIRIPIYHVGGWHDDFCSVSLENFRAAGGVSSPCEQRLLMGMWPHHLNQRTDHGGIDYGSDAVIDLYGREKMFLDRHLLGKDCDPDREPPVRVFIMGDNRWESFADWPPPAARKFDLYLRAGGLLSLEPPGTEAPDEYVYDPLNPTPFPWDYGEPELPVIPGWEPDPRPGSDRLIYALPPIAENMTLIGPVDLKLFAQTDAHDTDWFACIAWEDPDTKKARLLTYGGCLRARFREGFERASRIRPGECHEYDLPLGNTARTLKKGSRLLLCLQSSMAPWYTRNLNTGGDNYRETGAVAARQTIRHDASRPTHVRLTLLPGGMLR